MNRKDHGDGSSIVGVGGAEKRLDGRGGFHQVIVGDLMEWAYQRSI